MFIDISRRLGEIGCVSNSNSAASTALLYNSKWVNTTERDKPVKHQQMFSSGSPKSSWWAVPLQVPDEQFPQKLLTSCSSKSPWRELPQISLADYRGYRDYIIHDSDHL